MKTALHNHNFILNSVILNDLIVKKRYTLVTCHILQMERLILCFYDIHHKAKHAYKEGPETAVLLHSLFPLASQFVYTRSVSSL